MINQQSRCKNGHIETRTVHADNVFDWQFGDVATPLHMSVNFVYSDLATTRSEYGYARHRHPSREQLEAALAAIEGCEYGLAFSSGVAALDGLLRTLAPGDHVVAGNDLFGGTFALFEQLFRQFGLDFTYVDTSDLEAVETAMTDRTRLVFVETPSNPFLKISNIAAIAEIAHASSAKLAVDNTFATPLLQQPLFLGADFALYSTTKYHGGHSDLTGGALLLNDPDDYARIRYVQYAAGAVPSTFDCWLLMRSLKTLALRVERQNANAGRIAEFLASHGGIDKLYYPGLADHPGKEIAARQMTGFGAMISFEPKGGLEAAEQVFGAVKIFTRASSLGAIESLIVAPIAGPHIARAGTDNAPPPNLLRLSIGIENADDLIADLSAALDAVS
jgi:cystathionine gamma-synthase